MFLQLHAALPTLKNRDKHEATFVLAMASSYLDLPKMLAALFKVVVYTIKIINEIFLKEIEK